MYKWIMSEAMVRNNWDDILRDPDNPRPDISSADEWIELAKTGGLQTLGGTIVIQNELPKFDDVCAVRDYLLLIDGKAD